MFFLQKQERNERSDEVIADESAMPHTIWKKGSKLISKICSFAFTFKYGKRIHHSEALMITI